MGYCGCSVDPKIKDADIEVLFKAADTDRSGEISFEEFYEAYEHHDPDGLKFDLQLLVRRELKAELKGATLGRLFLLTFLLCVPPRCCPWLRLPFTRALSVGRAAIVGPLTGFVDAGTRG